MEDNRTPSEHVRLELEMLREGDSTAAADAPKTDQPGEQRRILVVTADENMRAYLENCLRRIPRARILEAGSRLPPDLIVYDAVNGDRGDWLPDRIARLLVLDEPPAAHERLEDAESDPRRGFIVTPFDERTVVRTAIALMAG